MRVRDTLAYASSSGSIGLTTRRFKVCAKWHLETPQCVLQLILYNHKTSSALLFSTKRKLEKNLRDKSKNHIIIKIY